MILWFTLSWKTRNVTGSCSHMAASQDTEMSVAKSLKRAQTPPSRVSCSQIESTYPHLVHGKCEFKMTKQMGLGASGTGRNDHRPAGPASFSTSPQPFKVQALHDLRPSPDISANIRKLACPGGRTEASLLGSR